MTVKSDAEGQENNYADILVPSPGYMNGDKTKCRLVSHPSDHLEIRAR